MKKRISYIFIAITPFFLVSGWLIFGKNRYAFAALAIAVLAILAQFLQFERRQQDVTSLVLIAVLTALSVVGRMVFSPLPFFKPVTAMTVITALSFGPQAGFMTGALTALVSNFYFGQGGWTPFQMLAFGTIGLVAGLLAGVLKNHRILLYAFGAVAGVFYSLFLDVYTVLYQDGYFNFWRYAAAVSTSFPMMVLYAFSNILFLFFLAKPIGKVLNRLCLKYGL